MTFLDIYRKVTREIHGAMPESDYQRIEDQMMLSPVARKMFQREIPEDDVEMELARARFQAFCAYVVLTPQNREQIQQHLETIKPKLFPGQKDN